MFLYMACSRHRWWVLSTQLTIVRRRSRLPVTEATDTTPVAFLLSLKHLDGMRSLSSDEKGPHGTYIGEVTGCAWRGYRAGASDPMVGVEPAFRLLTRDLRIRRVHVLPDS